MEYKKSMLDIEPFASNKGNDIITRITDLRNVYEFVKESKLHFSPLSKFSDHTEGKKFDELKMDDKDQNNENSMPIIRRKVMYASCWYNGGETLNLARVFRLVPLTSFHECP